MDIFKDKRNHTQGGTKHINKHTTHEERTQEFAPFFAYIPQGKRKQQQRPQRHKNKQDKARGQAKDNQNKADKVKDKKLKQRDKTKGKRIKAKG